MGEGAGWAEEAGAKQRQQEQKDNRSNRIIEDSKQHSIEGNIW